MLELGTLAQDRDTLWDLPQGRRFLHPWGFGAARGGVKMLGLELQPDLGSRLPSVIAASRGKSECFIKSLMKAKHIMISV